MVPHACGLSSIDNGFAVVAGYVYFPDFLSYCPVAYLIFLNSSATQWMTVVSNITLVEYVFLNWPTVSTYSPAYGMSIDIGDDGQILIGIPKFDLVLLLSTDNGTRSSFKWISTFWSQSGDNILFGKYVAWLDNQTAAFLCYSLPVYPWSLSQIQVYNIQSSSQPIFVFPNNQQAISLLNKPLLFLSLLSWSSNMAILTDQGVACILASQPGYSSTKFSQFAGIFYIYTPEPCISGTYKNTTSVGPCSQCLPGTKNPSGGSTPCISCIPCNSSSFCPRGAVDDIDYSTIQRYTQSMAYPESPDATIFDDILIQTMFTIKTSSVRCLLVSPLFWTLLMISLSILILLIMGIINCFYHERHEKQVALIKKIFKQTDLIGEGELWIGGLMSFAIVVLVSFAYWFSSAYLKQYPIESVGDAKFSCDPTMRNAKFTSGLQLLSQPKSDKEVPIYRMLDSQQFTLRIDFVNTLFKCSNVSIVQNIGSNQIVLYPSHCNDEHITLAVSINLPLHQMETQFNLTGPYSIGGVSICLSGPPSTSNEENVSVQQLDFCQFFENIDDRSAFAKLSTIELKLTKVINKTVGLSAVDEDQFSGLWIPTFNIQTTITDELYYSQQGDYLRYLPAQTSLIVQLSETQFYIKNIQEPIARQAEIIFHNIL
ncbi:unnamed protein product, partial [Didymodactylos carnosus]